MVEPEVEALFPVIGKAICFIGSLNIVWDKDNIFLSVMQEKHWVMVSEIRYRVARCDELSEMMSDELRIDDLTNSSLIIAFFSARLNSSLITLKFRVNTF